MRAVRISLVVLMFFKPCPLFSSDNEDDPPRSPSLLSGISRTVNGMLDIVFAPLAYFSQGDNESVQLFNIANDLMVQEELNPCQLKLAADRLNESAIKGNALALYHMGALMVGLPESTWKRLVPFTEYNAQLGKAYLEEAQQKGIVGKEAERRGVVGAEKLLLQLRCLDMLNLALELVYDLNQPEDLEEARALVNEALKLESPHAAYLMAEALLKGKCSSHPWLVVGKKSLYERRIAAFPLLDRSLKADVPLAVLLRNEIAREDQIYSALCTEIMKQEAPLGEEGLVLGDAGFQETYIDMLCTTQQPLCMRVLTPSYAYFLKKAMMKRVSIIFQFLNDYSGYVNQCNKHLGKGIGLAQALPLMVDLLMGKMEKEIPELKIDDEVIRERVAYSFRDALLCPVTPLDVHTAYRLMIDGAEDFTLPLPPEPEEQETTKIQAKL